MINLTEGVTVKCAAISNFGNEWSLYNSKQKEIKALYFSWLNEIGVLPGILDQKIGHYMYKQRKYE